MPKGGKRIGAGRRPGTVTKKTRVIAEQQVALQKGGLSMLEIMIGNARYFYQQAIDAEAAIGELQPSILAGMEPQDQFNHMLAEVKKAAGLRQMAGEAAKDAARFLHAPMAAIQPTAAHKDEEVPLAERLKAYAREDAIVASAGKVVELKKAKRK